MKADLTAALEPLLKLRGDIASETVIVRGMSEARALSKLRQAITYIRRAGLLASQIADNVEQT